MKRKHLRILILSNLLFGVVILNCALSNPAVPNDPPEKLIVSNVKVVPMPTPTSSPPKTGCSIKITAPPPKINPGGELTFEILRNIAKSMDRDCDGISDFVDNCGEVFNPKQEDKNKNGTGDACEPKRKSKLKKRKS